MVKAQTIYQAPPHSGTLILGKTLPLLLDEGCDRASNVRAFNQWIETGWQPFSNQVFRSSVETIALGLLNLGLESGDRVAFLLHSDLHFCLADFGCLFAGLVDVPIDLTQTLENIIYVIHHSEAKALVISNLDLLDQIAPYLGNTPDLQFIIVADVPADWQEVHAKWRTVGSSDGKVIPETTCLIQHSAPHLVGQHPPVPQCIQLFSLEEIQLRGQPYATDDRLEQLRAALTPDQLATIIYIPGTTGELQGVMLTHENLTGNALASFSGLELNSGDGETVLSFLPLTHVFARSMLYGHIYYGHSVYFSNPSRVVKHLKEVRPTILSSVPLLLEKIYSKALEQGNNASNWFVRIVFQIALNLAKRYDLGKSPRGLYALLLKIADWLVLSQLRALFGGRIKYLLCGGAPLKPEIATVFGASGVRILQGYGLTQTSSVICYNRNQYNRAGTVGVPMPGVEIAIAPDQEILIRSPFVSPGYYKNLEETQSTIDPNGWLHTGDLGEFTRDGFLRITGIKKALFKLSTGKYIAPKALETQLEKSPFIAHAIIVGAEQKFCGAILFVNPDALHQQALELGLEGSIEELLQHPRIIATYRVLLDAANCHLPYWALVKRFHLIHAEFTVENRLLTETGDVNRPEILKRFAPEIAGLFDETAPRRTSHMKEALPPDMAAPACPEYARSLNPRLIH
jgi:long-chain acyl-CoA synthetase